MLTWDDWSGRKCFFGAWNIQSRSWLDLDLHFDLNKMGSRSRTRVTNNAGKQKKTVTGPIHHVPTILQNVPQQSSSNTTRRLFTMLLCTRYPSYDPKTLLPLAKLLVLARKRRKMSRKSAEVWHFRFRPFCDVTCLYRTCRLVDSSGNSQMFRKSKIFSKKVLEFFSLKPQIGFCFLQIR